MVRAPAAEVKRLAITTTCREEKRFRLFLAGAGAFAAGRFSAPSPLAAAALASSGLSRHLPAFPPRFAQADRNRLLAAGDALAGASGFEGPMLPLVHCAFDLGLRFLAVLCH